MDKRLDTQIQIERRIYKQRGQKERITERRGKMISVGKMEYWF